MKNVLHFAYLANENRNENGSFRSNFAIQKLTKINTKADYLQYVCLQKAIQKLTDVIRLFAESNAKADKCNTVVYKKQYKS